MPLNPMDENERAAMTPNRRILTVETYPDYKSSGNYLDPSGCLYDNLFSIPAKPLPQGTLNRGGSFFLWGQKKHFKLMHIIESQQDSSC
jgi:hypothetical protein